MQMPGRQLAILNLTSELPQELADYFTRKDIEVKSPESDSVKMEWSHIILKDTDDYTAISKLYNTLEKDIKLISLSTIRNIQNFVFANGKLIFDELWMKGPLGEFILDKFFQEYAGISLGDNYPKFTEKGAFNIVNPFNTGEYLDRMSHEAFDHGVSALSVKTFFDHINMYLTGLKNKSKVGFPIEVNYGIFDEIFGIQLHFYSQGLLMDDVVLCLSSEISKKAEEHLLNISVQSADFFDFTFLSQVNKVVITALWTKDERIKIENRGLMFSNLSSMARITGYQSEGLSTTLTLNSEIPDDSSKISLPERKENSLDLKISGDSLTEVLAKKISASMDLERLKKIVNGEIDGDQFSQLVSGNFGAEDGKIIISSNKELENIVQLVKGRVDDERESIKVSGEKFNQDSFIARISSGITNGASSDDLIKFKSLGEKLPESLKTGLFDFAKGINKKVEELSFEDLEKFEHVKIPEIVRGHTAFAASKTKGLLEDVRMKLSESLKEEFEKTSVDEVFSFVKSPEDEWRVKELLKSSLKISFDQNFDLSKKESITHEEQETLLKSLSSAFSENEDEMREIISSEAPSSESVVLFEAGPRPQEKKLSGQLDKMSQENTQLKNSMKTLLAEIKILKETKLRMVEANLKAQEAAKNALTETKDDESDDNLREIFQTKLSQQEALTQQEREKLAVFLEKEKVLLKKAREEDSRAKKIQLESIQKETMLMQEIEKINRQSKSKDLMLNKTREAMQKSASDHEKEIQNLRTKLDESIKALAAGPSQTMALKVKELQSQNQGLSKMLDVYKIKVSSLATNMQTKSDDASSKDEVRRLGMLNNQFKNQLEASKKEVTKLQDKLNRETAVLTELRQEKNKLEGILKKMREESPKQDKSQVNTQEMENNLKRTQLENQTLENQLKDITTKYKDVEIRYSELQKTQKGAQGTGDEASKGKVAQLEGSVKKLTHDLLEAKNQMGEMKKETNKLRQEKTALQNQLDRLKKEAEKTKGQAKKSA